MNPRTNRKRLLLSGAAVLCLAAGLRGLQRAGSPDPPRPAGAPASAHRAGEKADASALAEAWLAEADAARETAGRPSVVTITSPAFQGRRAAFRKLLEGLDRENGPALHAALSQAASGGSPAAPTDAEWEAFLEKRGKLEGSVALDQLSGSPRFPWQVPALLRGWASENPSAALAWLGQTAPLREAPHWRTAALKGLMEGWALRDPAGPALWFEEHQGDPAFDEAIAAYAAYAAAGDPAAAFRWAEAVEGPWRAHAIGEVAGEWLARDPAAATTALREAGYEDAEIGRFSTGSEGVDLTRGGDTDALHIAE